MSLYHSVGHTVVSMLTDINGFWAYDNREHLLAEDDAEDNAEENNMGGLGMGGVGGVVFEDSLDMLDNADALTGYFSD